MKEVRISGFTQNVISDVKPAVVAYGEDNTGTSRFGTTLPCSNGILGWLAIDGNSKMTVEEQKELRRRTTSPLNVLVNEKPFISHKDSIAIALNADTNKVKEIYTEVFKRVTEHAMKLADHADVESIVLDRSSQIFDIILFSHFGRRNQIESFQRGAPNQDMIDLINALRCNKNLGLICKASEVWKDTGEVDKNGKKKQAPTGKYKPDGFGQIGRFVTAVIELTAERKKLTGEDEDDILNKKYKCRIVTCKGATLLEGSELSSEGVCGRAITWQNLMNVIGADE